MATENGQEMRKTYPLDSVRLLIGEIELPIFGLYTIAGPDRAKYVIESTESGLALTPVLITEDISSITNDGIISVDYLNGEKQNESMCPDTSHHPENPDTSHHPEKTASVGVIFEQKQVPAENSNAKNHEESIKEASEISAEVKIQDQASPIPLLKCRNIRCNKSFKTPGSLAGHEKKCCRYLKGVIRCQVWRCNEEFKTEKEMFEHMDVSHTTKRLRSST